MKNVHALTIDKSIFANRKISADLQGTPEWFERRRGKVTGSKAKTIMHGGERGLNTYLNELWEQELDAWKPKDLSGVKAIRWGHTYEPMACYAYEELTSEVVIHTDFITLGDWIGYSPDGLVGIDGLLEIKCPMNVERWNEHTEKGCPKDYMAQIQFGLWVTGREWCDFVSFNPFEETEDKIETLSYIDRIERNEKYIKELEEKTHTFINHLKNYTQYELAA